MTVVVFVEHQEGEARTASLEALGAARTLSQDVVAVLHGADAGRAAAGLGARGAARVIAFTGAGPWSPDAVAQDVARAVREAGGKVFLASATSTGRDVAPRVAALLDATLLSDCTGLAGEEGATSVTRPWLAGKLVATMRSSGPVLCATLRRNQFRPSDEQAAGELTELPATTGGRAVLTAVEAKVGGRLDVAEAPVVVSGGRGLKEPEGFRIVEELAEAFGNAAVGASRAVVDAGWRPHAEQVGQTGKTVSPQLYVAIGISGAIQHLAGMKTAKVIVAINKDAEAPIFKVADFGIVGDAFEIVPALAAEVRRIRASG